MYAEKTFDTGTVTLNYAEGPPNGAPLLLLPGFMDRWQQWLPIMPALVDRWHLFAPDYRGHGKSGRAPGCYLPQHYMADIQAFIMMKFDAPVRIWGSSMGGVVAMHLAGMQPDAVHAVISGDIPLDFTTYIAHGDFQVAHARRHAQAGQPIEDLIPVLCEEGMTETQAVEMAETLHHLDPDTLKYHAEGRLAEFTAGVVRVPLENITCPLLLMQGNPTLGGMLSDDDVALARVTLPQVQHVYLEHVGHDLGLFTGDTDALLQAVIAFLDAV